MKRKPQATVTVGWLFVSHKRAEYSSFFGSSLLGFTRMVYWRRALSFRPLSLTMYSPFFSWNVCCRFHQQGPSAASASAQPGPPGAAAGDRTAATNPGAASNPPRHACPHPARSPEPSTRSALVFSNEPGARPFAFPYHDTSLDSFANLCLPCSSGQHHLFSPSQHLTGSSSGHPFSSSSAQQRPTGDVPSTSPTDWKSCPAEWSPLQSDQHRPLIPPLSVPCICCKSCTLNTTFDCSGTKDEYTTCAVDPILPADHVSCSSVEEHPCFPHESHTFLHPLQLRPSQRIHCRADFLPCQESLSNRIPCTSAAGARCRAQLLSSELSDHSTFLPAP